MSGFQFPPPPPPPPKASSNDSNGSQPGQFGQNSRGRGRGRGRGGQDRRGLGVRGRGDSSQPHGQHSTMNGQSHSPYPSNSFYGPSYGQSRTVPNGGLASQYDTQSISGIPPGSYVNPAFHQNVNNYGTVAAPSKSNPRSAQPSGSSESLQRNASGHKRKLEALRGSPSNEKKPAPPTAPSIPSFGNPILSAKASLPTRRPAQSKRSSNVLGLTPQDDQPQYSSDSDDDGVDEEAMYAELGTNLTFEHNGTVMSLNTAADLAAWKDERLRNFPTRKRLAARLEEKRQIAEERKRLLVEASQAIQAARAKVRSEEIGNSGQERRSSKSEGELEKAKKELAVQSARVEQLRQQAVQSEERAARARDHDDDAQALVSNTNQPSVSLNLSPAHNDPNGHHDSTIAATSPSVDQIGSGTHAEDVSDEPGHLNEILGQGSTISPAAASISGADETDDEGPPEEMSSTRPADSGHTDRVCRFFATRGTCKDGDMCTYKHERGAPARANSSRTQQQRTQPRARHGADEQDETSESSSRMTIFDRLLEQEQGQENKLALQVIKYLGQIGMFSKEKDDARC